MVMVGQRHAPAALYPREWTLSTHWFGGWVGLRAHRDAEAKGNTLCRGSNSGRPVCNPTLYWLPNWIPETHFHKHGHLFMLTVCYSLCNVHAIEIKNSLCCYYPSNVAGRFNFGPRSLVCLPLFCEKFLKPCPHLGGENCITIVEVVSFRRNYRDKTRVPQGWWLEGRVGVARL
jgi:hypothetical protein